MKNTLKLLTLSLALSTSVAYSTGIMTPDDADADTPPTVETTFSTLVRLTQNQIDKNQIDQDKAMASRIVKRGIVLFFLGKNDMALTLFREALGDYGSPLGYLYASALEGNEETATRYYHIANQAYQDGEISSCLFLEHKQCIYYFVKYQG